MFRNREIKKFAVIFIITTIISAIAAVAIHPAVLLLVFFSASAYGVEFLYLQGKGIKELRIFQNKWCAYYIMKTTFI